VESNSVCNHTSDNKIGRPCSGSPICLSRVWPQTELDDTKSYYQLIIKITISEKSRIPRYEKGKFELNVFTLFLWWLKPRLWLVDLNYNFECDWLSFLNQSQSRKLIIIINTLLDHSLNWAFQGQWKQMMKQIMQMNITWLRIPPGRWQTSWLFTNCNLCCCFASCKLCNVSNAPKICQCNVIYPV